MERLLLLCIVAAGVPLLVTAQYCMTGIPCGNGCTMGDGRCIRGRCFDRTGTVEWECMAPMPAPMMRGPSKLQSHDAEPQASWMPRFPTWQPWNFPSFTFWRPMMAPAPAWIPFGPIGAFGDCGGKGPCPRGEFCDAQQVCRPDDCTNQYKYGCPGDDGKLQKVACPHFSGFKECYASSTGGFRCFKGPSGSSLACATQSGTTSGALWTATEGFQSPDFPEDDADDKDTAAAAPKAESAAAAKAEDDTSSKSAFKKVVNEAGPAPAKPAPAAVPTAVPSFMVESANNAKQLPPMARVGPMTTPDGGALMAAGPGPAISVMNTAPNGMAGAMAAGDQKTVVTRRDPNGMTSMSSSVSSNGGPAVASSVATSGQQPGSVPDWIDLPEDSARPSTGQPSAAPVQPLPTQQGTAASSQGSSAGAAKDSQDTAKPTPAASVKNSAGSGSRGSGLLWHAVVAGCLALLLL